MKYLSLIFSASLLVFSSCGNEKPEAEQEKSPVEDSVAKEAYVWPAEIDTLLHSFPLLQDSIIHIDSTLIRNIENKDTITGDEIRFLSANYHSNTLFSFQKYSLENYLEMDSIIANGHYDEYLEHIDIGNTKYVNGKKLFYHPLGDSCLLFFWAIHYRTYEACPWGEGTYIFMTNAYAGRICETICIGLEDAGGDPPVAGSTDRYAELLSDGLIRIRQRDIGDEDMDQPKVELTEGEFEFKLEGVKIKSVKENPGKAKMVPRKSVGY